MCLRIILADDHNMIREGLSYLLKRKPGVKVVAEAENGRKAVRLCHELKPDVVIIDIAMPDLNGIEATRLIISELPGIKVIALTMHAEGKFVREMLRAGASGYLLKDSGFRELSKALDIVVNNQIYLSPEIADVLVNDYLEHAEDDNGQAFSVLTQREREVLQLIAEGKSTSQIASILYISEKTVAVHRQHITDKLKLESTAELTKYAIREGLTSLLS